jgi:hypothetical protein
MSRLKESKRLGLTSMSDLNRSILQHTKRMSHDRITYYPQVLVKKYEVMDNNCVVDELSGW